jgi:hypothetical protein
MRVKKKWKHFKRILFSVIILCSEIFGILQVEYQKVGLEFNSSMSDIVLFNLKTDFSAPSIAFWSSFVPPVDHLTFFGLPFASSVRHTQKLLLEQIRRRITADYASIAYSKLRFNRSLLVSHYNDVAFLHILYTAPFRKLLTKTKKSSVWSMFLRFAKYLLHLSPWYRYLLVFCEIQGCWPWSYRQQTDSKT